MFRININGRDYEFPEEISILKALRRIGIDIPTLCYDERLEGYGGCRLCIVKVEGWSRPVASCTTPLSDGMVIETHTPDIEKERRTLLKLIAWRYPAGPVRQFPDKEFHRWISVLMALNPNSRDPLMRPFVMMPIPTSMWICHSVSTATGVSVSRFINSL